MVASWCGNSAQESDAWVLYILTCELGIIFNEKRFFGDNINRKVTDAINSSFSPVQVVILSILELYE